MAPRTLSVGALIVTVALSAGISAQTLAQILQPPTVSSLLDQAKTAAGELRFDDAKRLLQQALSLIDAQQAALAATVAAAPGEPMRVGTDGVQEPKLIAPKTKPVYPLEAIAAKVQGIVYLEVVLAKDGSVKEVRVIRGPQMLQQAAIDAVKRWQYTTTRLNGEAVEVVFTVNVIFQLG